MSLNEKLLRVTAAASGTWQPDRDDCFGCNAVFTMTKRKHHCRSVCKLIKGHRRLHGPDIHHHFYPWCSLCGQVFCQPCTAFTAQLSSSKSVRALLALP